MRSAPTVGAPQTHPSFDERAEPVEHVIEPPYGRRSVMQMEFPCSLNWTASTSFRMRIEAAPAGLVELLRAERLGHGWRDRSRVLRR